MTVDEEMDETVSVMVLATGIHPDNKPNIDQRFLNKWKPSGRSHPN
jgi:hypothetical protein